MGSFPGLSLFWHSMHTRPGDPALLGLYVDAVQQGFQLVLLQGHARGAWVQVRREAEGAMVQPLVELAQPGAIKEEHLERLLSPTKKDEQGAGACVAADALGYQTREPIEAPAQIDGFQTDEDLDAMRDHDALRGRGARWSSTSSTEVSVARSKPGRRAIRTPWASRTSVASCGV